MQCQQCPNINTKVEANHVEPRDFAVEIDIRLCSKLSTRFTRSDQDKHIPTFVDKEFIIFKVMQHIDAGNNDQNSKKNNTRVISKSYVLDILKQNLCYFLGFNGVYDCAVKSIKKNNEKIWVIELQVMDASQNHIIHKSISGVLIVFNQLEFSKRGVPYPVREFSIHGALVRKIVAITRKYKPELFEKHSNLKFLKGDWKEIQGRRHNIPCIALYIKYKGKIPIREESFPRFLEGIVTDIREYNLQHLDGLLEDWKQVGLKSRLENEDHNHPLTIGSRIGIANSNHYGSVGCFLTNDNGERFVLTCAHILRKINYIQDNTAMYYPGRKRTKKKDSQLGQKIGNVLYSSNRKTDMRDYTLIRLDPQVPIQLQVGYPRVWKDLQVSSGLESLEFCEEIISLIEENRLLAHRESTRIYKCGWKTGMTVGRMCCYPVEFPEYHCYQFSSLLYKDAFAFEGDSGSISFMIEDGKLIPLGVNFARCGSLVFSIPMDWVLIEMEKKLKF